MASRGAGVVDHDVALAEPADGQELLVDGDGSLGAVLVHTQLRPFRGRCRRLDRPLSLDERGLDPQIAAPERVVDEHLHLGWADEPPSALARVLEDDGLELCDQRRLDLLEARGVLSREGDLEVVRRPDLIHGDLLAVVHRAHDALRDLDGLHARPERL
jgi:hypothetical protein